MLFFLGLVTIGEGKKGGGGGGGAAAPRVPAIKDLSGELGLAQA